MFIICQHFFFKMNEDYYRIEAKLVKLINKSLFSRFAVFILRLISVKMTNTN